MLQKYGMSVFGGYVFVDKLEIIIFIYTEGDAVYEIEGQETKKKNQHIFLRFVYLLFRSYIYHPSKGCNKKKRYCLYLSLSLFHIKIKEKGTENMRKKCLDT